MNNIYETLFNDQKTKAEAFDKIAENFYFANFGAMSKSEFEVLMFSIYIEQILENSEDDFLTYSDYTLSKILGISQPKIKNLKIKKELRYPYYKFKWKESFKRIIQNARYDSSSKMIKLSIPDPNLFIELQNAIEENGGYLEYNFNSKLLQVSSENYLHLLYLIADENEKEILMEAIRNEMQRNQINVNEFATDDFTREVKSRLPKIGITLLKNLVGVLPGGNFIKFVLECVVNSL